MQGGEGGRSWERDAGRRRGKRSRKCQWQLKCHPVFALQQAEIAKKEAELKAREAALLEAQRQQQQNEVQQHSSVSWRLWYRALLEKGYIYTIRRVSACAFAFDRVLIILR